MQHVCLIIENDPSEAERLRREFLAQGFKPYTVASCQSAMELVQHWRFDIVLLGIDGFGGQHLAALRVLKRRSRAPVVLMTSAQGEAIQLAGFAAGASDVVVLPASAQLLCARLRRTVHAFGQPAEELTEVTVGPLTMNARHGTATVDLRPLVLTVHQFDLLYLLAIRVGEFVHRDAIARAVGSRAMETSRSADVHVSRIRKKLREIGAASLRLDTVHGRGYCLSIDLSQRQADFEESGAFNDSAQPVFRRMRAGVRWHS